MSEAERDQPEAVPRSRQLVRRVLLGTAIGVLVFAGLSLYADVRALLASLESFRWRAFALALALVSGNYVIRYARWHYYLGRLDLRVPHLESALVFLAGFVMSITPGKLGEVFKSLLLFESRGISVARTAPVVIAERLTDLLALVALTAVGSLSFREGLPLAIGGGVIVAFALLAAGWAALGELLLRIAGRLPLIGRFEPKFREAYVALRTMTGPTPLLFATVLATVGWALEAIALLVIISGFPDAALGWEEGFFAYSASTIAGALAMMPGGLGVTEAGMTGLLEALSEGEITSATATAITMLCRLATLWWAVVLGAFALGAFRLLRAKQIRAARGRAGDAS